jgi:hypothetical protein
MRGRNYFGLNDYQKDKLKKTLCIEKLCMNKAPKHRHRCHKCFKRLFAQRNPVRYYFDNLVQNAKKRGSRVEFSFKWFKNFVTGKLFDKDGKRLIKHGSIDRIRNDIRVYREGNVQILTLADNTRKQYIPYWNESPI